MATVFNPLTGQVTTTPDTIKTSPSLGQFNNAATPLSDLQQSAADARAAANALKTTTVDPGRAAQQAAADALNAKNALPKKGTVLSYREGQPGLRIPQIADGKGGFYFGPPEAIPDYKKPVGGAGADVSMTGMPIVPPAGGSVNADPGALQIITDALTSAGLGSLTTSAWDMWKKGFDIGAIMDDPVNGIRASTIYKQTFPGMAALNAAGRGISETTYLAKEKADLEIMKQYNLTPGIFDTKEYLAKLMVNNVNATDLINRLNAFQDTVGSYDANIKKYAKDTFGISDGDLMTWAMDPTKALPAIQQQAKAMQIGGAAIQAGFGGAGANGELTKAQSEALAAQGITQAQAQQGFTNLGQMGQYGQALPGTDVSGSLTNQQMIDAQFQSNAAAIQALQKVKGTRTAEFQAGGGAAATAAGVVGAGANLAT